MCDLIKFSPTAPRRSIFSRPALVEDASGRSLSRRIYAINLRDYIRDICARNSGRSHRISIMPCTCVRPAVVTRLDGAKYVSHSFGNDVHARVHAAAQVRSTLIDTHAFLVRSLSTGTAGAPFAIAFTLDYVKNFRDKINSREREWKKYDSSKIGGMTESLYFFHA